MPEVGGGGYSLSPPSPPSLSPYSKVRGDRER